MTPADVDAFAMELMKTAEVLAEPLSAARIAGYFEALEDLAWPDVAGALRAARRRCRFFPKPVELRELVAGTSEDAAYLLWARLNQAAYTEARPPPLSAPGRAALEAVGGWRAMRQMPVTRLGQLSQVFVRTYVARARMRDRRRALPAAAGGTMART